MSKLSATIHRGIIGLALSFSFMFFVYAPLEVYFGNTTEFWFDITNLGPIVIVCFLISSAILILAQELLYKFLYPISKSAKRLFYIIYTVMLMIFIGLYIQGNYIPRDYGVLDGSDIDWASYTSYGIVSVVLWLVIVIVGILLWIKCRKQIFKIGQGVSAIIFIMLMAALISLVLKAENMVDESNLVVTDEAQWTLSENKNIYVLVLDTFDAEYLRVLLEEEGEEYSELLEDFTFYSNTTGGYPTTKGAIPLILTGKWYENDISFDEYRNENGKELLEVLNENDYSIGVYVDNIFINKDMRDYYENVYQGRYKIANPVSFAKLLYKLITFEYLPHQLKSAFLVTTSDFEEEKVLANEGEGHSAYTMSDEIYYKTICEQGFNFTSDQNCFRFVHLRGMHVPYTFGEDVVVDGNEYTYMDTAKGNMNEVKALLDSLKVNGVYDNTAIMILADHGGGTLASELNCNPLLLVKGFDEHHDFTISENPISQEDIYPTLLSWASGENRDDAVWNVPDEERERRFLYYVWDGSRESEYLPVMEEYSIIGNVADKTASLTKTGRFFSPGVTESNDVSGLLLQNMEEQNPLTDSPYKIEVPIDSENADFQSMYVSGLGEIKTRENGQKYAWSNGYYTYFRLNPEGEQNFSYIFTINFDEIYNEDISDTAVESIYATINGERVVYENLTETSMSFIVPQEALSADVVDVMIYYPDFANGGENDKALAITSVVLEQNFPVLIEDTFTIDLSQDGNFEDMISDGWNSEEEGGIWTKEDAKIQFLADNDSDFLMQINYYSLSEEVPTVVKLNGHEVCTLNQENAGSIVLPKEYFNPAVQVLEFLTEGALTPEEAGINSDTRTLGIYVKSITLTDSKAFLPIDISFKSENNTASNYIASGFSDAEPWGTWMIGKEAVMSFFVPRVQNDLLLTLECGMTQGEQNIAVYANDSLLEEFVFSGSGSKSIEIPKECVKEDVLILRFELPDAISPKETGEGTDERELAIGVTGLKLERIEE